HGLEEWLEVDAAGGDCRPVALEPLVAALVDAAAAVDALGAQTRATDVHSQDDADRARLLTRCSAGHLLMPAVSPATICLVATRKSTIRGTVAMTSPANSDDQSVENSPKNVVNPTGTVYFSRLRNSTNGNRKSFQIGTKRKTTTVATAGRTIGTMIRRNICQLLAPSIRAASSSSD